MTEERDDFLKIYDTIINNDGLWDDVKFIRKGNKLLITAKDKFGSNYVYSEELI